MGAYAYSDPYAVDGAGSRTGQTVGGVSTAFAYDSDDELTATSGGFTNSYGYNANGDQTSRTVGGVATTLAYDYDDQMTAAGATTFTYDAGGRRVSRAAGGATTAYQYDGGSVLLEKQGSSTTATYTYGNSLLRKDGETPLFDGLGSERTVTSSGSSTAPYQFGATSGYRSGGDGRPSKVGARH